MQLVKHACPDREVEKNTSTSDHSIHPSGRNPKSAVNEKPTYQGEIHVFLNSELGGVPPGFAIIP